MPIDAQLSTLRSPEFLAHRAVRQSPPRRVARARHPDHQFSFGPNSEGSEYAGLGVDRIVYPPTNNMRPTRGTIEWLDRGALEEMASCP